MSRNSNRMARKAPPANKQEDPQESQQPQVQVVRRTANTEFVELPSRGLFYPQNHPLYEKDTVEIRFMTARDEDILTSPALLRKGQAIDKFIQNRKLPDLLASNDKVVLRYQAGSAPLKCGLRTTFGGIRSVRSLSSALH